LVSEGRTQIEDAQEPSPTKTIWT